MKISKITKILPLALAFALATTGAYAEGAAAGENTEATNSSQTIKYSLDLQPFLDIETVTANTQTTSNTSFSNNYTGITIDTPLKGEFQVIGNQVSQSVALEATCEAGGTQKALYTVAGAGGGLRIIFTNNTNAAVADDITAMKTTYTTASSPNAIAFAVTPTFKHEETPSQGFLNEPALASDKIIYTVPNGKHTFTYTIGTTAVDNSFSTLDTNGTYKATLTMSSYTATP